MGFTASDKAQISVADLIARVDALLPKIAASAAAADANRRVSDEIIQDLTDAGVFATIAPKAYGGLEFGLDVFSEIVRRISSASPSIGWVAAFLMGAAWRVLVFPREAQIEIFGDKNYVLGAGAAQPIMDVKKVSGGYVLNGRTKWNSGSSHAEWFSMNGLLFEDGQPPSLLTFALKRSDVKIIDDWHILGMQATASCALEVKDLFVPEYRSADFGGALTGASAGHALHANPMYHVPFVPFAMNEVIPVIVGTHRGAFNAFEARMRQRMGTLSGAKAAEKGPAQVRLGKAAVRADLAEQLLAALVHRNMTSAPSEREPIHRARAKAVASMITEMCLDSVNEMARGVGGDAFRNDEPFQRYFRDLNVVGRHAFLDAETAGESYAQLMLGLTPGDPII